MSAGAAPAGRSAGHYGAIVTPTFAFGLDVGCKNCLWHLEGEKLLWSVGAQVVTYSTLSQEMRFVPLADRGARALALAVASNNKYFAVVERAPGMDHDQVSVYSCAGEKRVKTLPHDGAISGSESNRVECLHFSENGKLLLTQYGAPDWTLVVWRWYSGKVLASLRVDARVVCASFSPVDDMLLAVATPTSLAQYRLDPDHDLLKPMAAPAPWDTPHITAMCWLAGNLLAAVGSGGEVYAIQDTVLRLNTRVEPLPGAHLPGLVTPAGSRPGAGPGSRSAAGGGGGGGGSGGNGGSGGGSAEQLLAVTARGRGFVAAGSSGTVYFFDPPGVDQKRAGVRDMYVLSRRLLAGHDVLPLGRALVRLSVSSGDEEVVAVSSGGDVLVANMGLVAEREEKPLAGVVGAELLEGEPFRRLLGGFLCGRVTGLAAAASVPVLAVASADDRQLRVWNYEARRCVASVAVEEEVTCLDVHPGGHMVLAGLYDKIQLYGVLMDALDPVWDAPVKRATAVRFSHGGAVFAAVGRSNAISVHATYHGSHLLATLKGHATTVTGLAFSSDDRQLVSCGQGGAVYFWDMTTFSRLVELEHVDKQSVYHAVVMSGHGPGSAVLRASDGRVRQILGGRVEYEVACKGGTYAPACLLGGDKVYLAADDQGSVVSHTWPSELPPRPGFAAIAPPPHVYALHSAAGGGITRMVLLPSRGLLFTASGDGTVLMSSVALVLDGVLLEAAGAQAPGRQHAHHSQAGGPAGAGPGASAASPPFLVTVPEERLSSLREKVLEVAQLVGSARSEAEYQAFRAAQLLRDAISRLEADLDRARAAVAERDATIARLQDEARLLERRVIKELEGAHMSAAEELETLYEKRLALEADKLRLMVAARDDAVYQSEESMRRLREAHAKQIQDLEAAHAAALLAAEARLHGAEVARSDQDRFFNEYVKQAEEDFEDHTERINDKINVISEAAEAREQRLKADNNILKRTNLRLKADKTLDLKRMDKLTADNAQLRETSEELKLTIDKLAKELEERDSVNADNYATIQQLRRKVQDLEKHKFVLSYKAETYAKAMEPQEKEVARLQGELQGHDKELLGQLGRLQAMSRTLAEKDTALRSLKAELHAVQDRASRQEAAITAFSEDLYSAMMQPDDRGPRGKSARQKALEELLHKYCAEGGRGAGGNRDAASEAAAAAAAAETRVVLLQWRLEQDARIHNARVHSSLHQNSQLLRELQVAQQDYRALKDRFESANVAIRELHTKYRLLERKVRGGGGADGGGEQGASDEGADGGGDAGDEVSAGVVSLAGRVAPSRPVSGFTVGGGSNGRPASAAPRWGSSPPAGKPASLHGPRPGTASKARPGSANWGLHRSVGASPRGGPVAKGAPLRAYAELIACERQRMQELAAVLQEGAAAAAEQQRAMETWQGVAAEAAAGAADRPAGLQGSIAGLGLAGVVEGPEGSAADTDDGAADEAGGDRAGPIASGDGPEEAGSRAAARSSTRPGSGHGLRRSVPTGLRMGGADAPGPSRAPHQARPMTATLESLKARSASTGWRVRSVSSARSAAAAAATSGNPDPTAAALAEAAQARSAGGTRRRPSSAGGMGIRAFTDRSVDRYIAPVPPGVESDLPNVL